MSQNAARVRKAWCLFCVRVSQCRQRCKRLPPDISSCWCNLLENAAMNSIGFITPYKSFGASSREVNHRRFILDWAFEQKREIVCCRLLAVSYFCFLLARVSPKTAKLHRFLAILSFELVMSTDGGVAYQCLDFASEWLFTWKNP